MHNRRQIISSLQTVSSAHKLVDEIAPKLVNRTSGHLRVERTRLRRGDNAQLAKVEFVDDLSEAPVAKTEEVKKTEKVVTKPKQAAKKAMPKEKS